MMITKDFTTTLLVDQSPEKVFDAVTNPRGWWSEEIEGGTEKMNDEFDYHFEDLHLCKMKLIEVIPDQKVVWLVLENYFKFTKDSAEWTGTTISFEISRQGDRTQLVFTHHGLTQEYECYNICNDGWTNYIQHSLRGLITTGQGTPNSTGSPTTETEEKLRADLK